MHFNHVETLIPALIVIAAICQYLAWRLKFPAILFLLLSGLMIGPILHWVQPDDVFGDLLMPVVSLSVALILFEGSLSLHFHEIKSLRRTIQNLVSVGMLINWSIIALASHYIMGLSWGISWLFGSLVVVTGPTVIVPMLRSIRPTSQVSSILRWEGILIDPIGALLAVLVFTWLASEGATSITLADTATTFLKIFFIGGIIGLLAGQILGLILRHYLVPDFLHTLVALAFVLSAFLISNELAEEAGLLAVTIMGIRMANMKDVHVGEILHFKEHLSILLISSLFIILSARIELSALSAIALPALAILLVMQFIARPAAVFVSSLGSRLSFAEKIVISWVGPRGIVAAAVSALFAFRLNEAGMDGADLLVPLTFFMIIGTVILQSATAGPLSNFLGVSEPEAKGFLLLGASPVAQALGKVLKDMGFRVLLTSSTWLNIRQARLSGLNTFYGNAISEQADLHLDLVGIGHLITLSPDPNLNSLAALKYRSEFGRKNIFALNAHREGERENKKISNNFRGIQLNPDINFYKFSSLLSKGAKVRTTKLTEEFTLEDLTEKSQTHQSKVIPLLAISPNGSIRAFGDHNDFSPKQDWMIISLDYSILDDRKEEKPAKPS